MIRRNIKNILFFLAFYLTNISHAATFNINVTDQNNKPVKDAVIALSAKENKPIAPSEKIIIDQVNKTYVPHVKTIVTGSKIFFPNGDDIRHHVYSFSAAKKFELPLYEGTPSDPVVFDKEGVVTLGCNIHDWMRAYIYITDTPYFSQTDIHGEATIKNIPAGIYQIKIWQPLIKTKEILLVKEIQLRKDSNELFTQQLTLKPNIKIRRAPKVRKRRY